MLKLKFVIFIILITTLLFSQTASDYFYKGLELESRGLLDEAIQLYTLGLEIEPSSYQLYNARGIAYKKKKKYDYAIRDYTKAIQLNPNFVYAYNNRAISYYFMNNFFNSKNDFLIAIKLNPNEGYYYFLNVFVCVKISNEEGMLVLNLLKENINMISDNWAYQIGCYLIDKIKEKELLIKTEGQKERLCEAYFYIAVKSLLKKQKFRARSYFKKVLKTNLTNFIEYEIAAKELNMF